MNRVRFLQVLKSGYTASAGTRGNPVDANPEEDGGSGFSPESFEMRASFFVKGVGIAAHRDLGVTDMRQISCGGEDPESRKALS
jgi:hypothetical protein